MKKKLLSQNFLRRGCSEKFHAESFSVKKLYVCKFNEKVFHHQFFANNFMKLCRAALGN